MPALVWFALGLVVYVAWGAGATVGAQLVRAAWGEMDAGDLRAGGATALGAYGLAIAAIATVGASLPAPLRRAGLWRAPNLRDARTGLIGLALVLPIMLMLLAVGSVFEALSGGQPEPLAHETLRALRGASPASLWWWTVVAGAVILAPVFEEWLYRGFVQTALRSVSDSPWIAVAGTAIVFTLAHAGGGGADARTLPSLLALGIALGLLLERTGSLWPCVIAHAAFNAFNVALALAIP